MVSQDVINSAIGTPRVVNYREPFWVHESSLIDQEGFIQTQKLSLVAAIHLTVAILLDYDPGSACHSGLDPESIEFLYNKKTTLKVRVVSVVDPGGVEPPNSSANHERSTTDGPDLGP